jgi:hypothetical protein
MHTFELSEQDVIISIYKLHCSPEGLFEELERTC